MKLLIVTQKVDRTDPILGFFHAWISEFAKRCESVTVIGQYIGEHSLPKNVEVLSLNKEKGYDVQKQVWRFWWLTLSHRSSYDAVFVHMTPIWILLGAPLWIVLRKRMYLWYEIKRGSAKLTLALRLVKKVFAASQHGLPNVAKKQVTVGHGIDVMTFVPNPSTREKNHIVAVGRLTKVKQYEVICSALSQLPNCRLTIAGGTVTSEDKETEKSLRELLHRLNIADRVEIGWVSPDHVPELLQRADCMLHASQGGLDKAVLQAMACGCPVISTSEAAQSVLPALCHASADSMAEQTKQILALSSADRQSLSDELRSTAERQHSLSRCIEQLVTHMQ